MGETRSEEGGDPVRPCVLASRGFRSIPLTFVPVVWRHLVVAFLSFRAPAKWAEMRFDGGTGDRVPGCPQR